MSGSANVACSDGAWAVVAGNLTVPRCRRPYGPCVGGGEPVGPRRPRRAADRTAPRSQRNQPHGAGGGHSCHPASGREGEAGRGETPGSAGTGGAARRPRGSEPGFNPGSGLIGPAAAAGATRCGPGPAIPGPGRIAGQSVWVADQVPGGTRVPADDDRAPHQFGDQALDVSGGVLCRPTPGRSSTISSSRSSSVAPRRVRISCRSGRAPPGRGPLRRPVRAPGRPSASTGTAAVGSTIQCAMWAEDAQ